MRVLILGGTGLISTPMVGALTRAGHEVVLYNRGQTTARHNADVEVVHGDRNDFENFEIAVKEIAPEVIIDMLTFDSFTAENSIIVAKQLDVKQYIFCSATAVYGHLSTIPADEAEPHTPTGQYGEGKSEAEQVFLAALEGEAFPVTIIRPAHVYGPGQALPSIWGYDACLVSRIRTDKPVIVPGDGFGGFDLIYADDLAEAFAGVVGRTECIGQVYNVAPNVHTDWRTYLETIGTTVKKEVNIIPVPSNLIVAGSPPDASILLEEIYQYPMSYSNAHLAKHLPDWSPKVSLEDGIRRTIEWLTSTNGHMVPDEQEWVDGLIDKVLDFEKDLALSDFAFDEKLLNSE
jgi:nucleoside-diphosphate-sugar epimerase